MADPQSMEKVRLDRWLLAARFFKTRSLAAEAIEGGKVQVNGRRVKRSRLVGVGDRIRIRKGPFEHHLVVRGLAEKRGSAERARELYEESEASIRERERLTAQMKAEAPALHRGKGRPTKKDRRQLDRLRKPTNRR